MAAPKAGRHWSESDANQPPVRRDLQLVSTRSRLPPLSFFKGLLLARWHDLYNAKLGKASADRASLRQFCGFSTNEPTPERTAFVRFRAELVKRGLDRWLFAATTAQLRTKGVVVRTGTLVDATLIPSASVRHDDARRAGHRRCKPAHGYKVHITTDRDAALIETVEVTTVHDAALLDVVLPPDRVTCMAIAPSPVAAVSS
jgi:IS5 family transposase